VLPGDGPRRTALVVEHGDEVRVYENRCPHWSVPLDGPNGVLLTEDAVRLRCSVHGAEFLWQDGRCVAGPCEGAHLQALPSRLEDDMIIIERPPLTAGTGACEA
jgi:nitrite reductase/ring-hydroxylating ferredoxin subunit